MIKKITALFLTIVYLSMTNLVYAYSELYYLYNINPTTAAAQIETVLADKVFPDGF